MYTDGVQNQRDNDKSRRNGVKMATLKLEGITREFAGSKGVFDLDLEIEDGEFFVLLGPSGCGKTTTLRIIAGLEMADQGKIFLNNREITAYPPKNRDMAMVFQNYALYPFLTVAQNLAFPLRKRKVPQVMVRRKVEEISKVLGISDLLDRKPGQISGGQRQRVALGRAIVREPSVFLMDEPLSNLDAKLRTTMRGELKRIQRSYSTTTVYVTHDQVEAMTLADRVCILDKGKLVQLDSPMEIYSRPKNQFVATFVGDPQMNMISAELVTDGASPHLLMGDKKLDLDVSGIKIQNDVKSLDVDIGFRPENVTRVDKGGIMGKVRTIQNLGREKLEHVLLNDLDKEVIAITPESSESSVGDIVSIMPAESKFYVFDKASGERIWPVTS